MKKTRKLLAALLAAAMLLSLTIPALASVVPLGDPNECPYCGIGSYRTFRQWKAIRVDPASKIPCQHGWSGYWDGMKQDVYDVRTGCTNEMCRYYYPDVAAHEEYENLRWACLHDNDGMRLGGETS